MESSVERRWTYRPLVRGAATADEKKLALAERVEVAFELVDTGSVPPVREMVVTKTEVKVVKENKVDLMVPTGYVRLSRNGVQILTEADRYARTFLIAIAVQLA